MKKEEKQTPTDEEVSIVKNIKTLYKNCPVNLICTRVVHSSGTYGSKDYNSYYGYYWKVLFRSDLVNTENYATDGELENLGFELKPIENELYYQKALDPSNNTEDFEYILSTLLSNEYSLNIQSTFAQLDEDLKSTISKELVLCNNEILFVNKGENEEVEIVLNEITLSHYVSVDYDIVAKTGYVPKFQNGKYCVGNQCITSLWWVKERESKLHEIAITETILKKLEKETGKKHTVEDLKEIKEIDLSNLGIQELHFLRNFPNLEILNLNMNNISDLVPLYFTRKLKKLFLSNNKITDIDSASFRNSPNLEVLDLSNNAITEIYASRITLLENLKSLKYLNVNNTNIKELKN